MNSKTEKNESLINKALQDFSDIVFGVGQSYIPYCFDYSQENGHIYNESKVQSFINSMVASAQDSSAYAKEFELLLPHFFELSLKFLTVACPSSDWILASFQKLAHSIPKSDLQSESIFDIIVSENIADLRDFWSDGSFDELYEVFSSEIIGIDFFAFEQCVDHLLKKFATCHQLNVFHDDIETQIIMDQIDTFASEIQRNISRLGRRVSYGQ